MPLQLLSSAPCGGKHYTYRFKSPALTRANIPAGSRLLTCPNTEPRDGDLVVIQTPVGKLVRFFRRCGKGLRLDTGDPDIPPLILRDRHVAVLGVVCAVLT